jgi:hypothetical protein
MPAKAPVRSPKKASSAPAAMPSVTVIGALEDADDYKAFEAAIVVSRQARLAIRSGIAEY